MVNKQTKSLRFRFYNHLPQMRGTTATTINTISKQMRNLNLTLRMALLLCTLLTTTFVYAYDFESDGIYYQYVDNGVFVTNGENEYSGEIVIPETVTYNDKSYIVIGIGEGAFLHNYDLTKITMGNSIKEIGDYAFTNCLGLTSITLPTSLRTIGYSAFGGSGLKSITIPDSVTIDDLAFNGTPIENITISNSAMLMGGGIFDDTPWFTNQQSNELIYAGSHLYRYNCDLPKDLTVIIPEGTIGIAGDALNGEWGGITHYDLTSIIRLEIPKSVRYIGNDIFAENEVELQSLSLEEGLEVVGEHAFYGANKLRELVIPNSVREIKKYAFYNCTSLKKLTVGNGTKIIEESAFSRTNSLEELTLGSGLERIKEWNFFPYEGKLTKVTSLATTPPVYKWYTCFGDATYTNATLFVPKGLEDAYLTAEGWEKFIHIVGIDTDPVPGDVNGDREVNIADINQLVDAILVGTHNEWMDVNGDGEVNIADINQVVQIILDTN